MNEIKPSIPVGAVNGPTHKSKELQMEIMMEKLRSKHSQYKNLQETSKAVRMTLLDKRWAVDNADRAILQKCLDSLQHCIKVSSLQSLIERLECLSRQLGLKFMLGTSGVEIFISSDMFYLEILLEHSGTVKDVKIHHEGKIEQQSCEELVSCITRGDFADFTAQLEGLTAIYQLNAEKKVKCKAFSALQSLEADLCTLGQMQSFIKEPWAMVHKSPIGFLQKRRGGHAMRLTYFISPYELLDKEKGLQPLTLELLTNGKPNPQPSTNSMVGNQFTPLGYSATVLLEGSASNKLQVSPIITVGSRPQGKSGPIYATLGLQNSSTLPACFTLKLNKPMVLCSGLAKIMQSATEVEIGSGWNDAKPLLASVVEHVNQGKHIDLSKGLYISLPDQNHCYFLSETEGLTSRIVNSIPFTHPAHVPHLLHALRQQALLNTLLASVVRSQANTEIDTPHIFEVSALSWTQMSISLEHPLDESMATVELDLSDAAAPKAALHTLSSPIRDSSSIDEYITRVLQCSLSLPVTLRALLKLWTRESRGEAGDSGASTNGGGARNENGNGRTGNGLLPDPSTLSLHGGTPQQQQESGDRKPKKRRAEGNGGGEWGNAVKRREGEESDSDTDTDSERDSDSSIGNEIDDDGDEESDCFSGDEEIRSPFHKSEFKKQKHKKDSSRSSSALDLTENAYMPASVSITPIGSSASQSPTNITSLMNLDRRPGIELIPITTTPPTNLPSSITITPIPPATTKSLEEKHRSERKRSSDERRPEKKKKKKREDPMGPPEKVPSKQDPLTKPVSVSIKPTEGSPSRSTSPSMRKFSPSPTHNRPVTLSKSPSPSSMRNLSKSSGTSSHHSSPRHSPVQNSPKHLSGYSSPKNHSVSSPKHSSSSSGKPSMYALKSAAGGSPSGKSSGYDLSSKSSKSSSSKDGYSSSSSRDKEKKHSGLSFSSSGGSSPKMKSSSVKLKNLEITAIPNETVTAEPLVSPPSLEIAKTCTPSAVRNRKGSLSAVIDKLKSAQHCSEGEIATPKSSSSNKERQSSSTNLKTSSDSKNSEYMVKHSSDGMKITINKTRTKDTSSSKSSFSNSSSSVKQSLSPQLSTSPSQGSPKTHTGLKPGVISGPASKKTQVLQSSTKPVVQGSNNSPTPTTVTKNPISSNSSSNQAKSPYSKSSSGSNLTGINLSKSSSKSTGSPKSSNSDPAKIARDRDREKSRQSKSSSEKSLFGKTERHSSPSSRDEVDSERKCQPKDASFLVEGLIKPLDKASKFQIPKLKNTTDKGSPGAVVNDFSARSLEHGKYPYPLMNAQRNALDVSKSMPSKIESNTSRHSPIPNQKIESTDLSAKDIPKKDEIASEGCMRPPSVPRIPEQNESGLLDFSVSATKNQVVSMRFPASPSVSLHIVHSPAPSPMLADSSPAITDDEMLDEGLVGPGK